MNVGMKSRQWLFLAILTVVGCFLAAFNVFWRAMFMVTCERTWLMVVPIAILGLNVLSIPIYAYVLVGGWRYLYNICITILVTVICFYGAIGWAESIHSLKGSKGFLVGTIIGVVLSIIGMLISIIISQRKKKRLKEAIE